MTLEFTRNIENFICGHCGEKVVGNGYTNHCPKCLWSRHVDIHPGDRDADCGGMMEPVGLEVAGGAYDIIHRCIVCGHQKPNKTAPEDDIGSFLSGLL